MQKHVNLVDLVKSFPTNIFLQNLASIQKRTSPLKFAQLAEKSDKGSISNLSTKVEGRPRRPRGGGRGRAPLPRRPAAVRGGGVPLLARACGPRGERAARAPFSA